MRTYLWPLFAFVVLFVPSVVSAEPVRLRVGVIAGFSGDWASYGEAYRRGIELAQVDSSIEFLYEDDQFLPAKTVSAVNKLLHEGRVDALIVGDTATARAIGPIVQKRKIPTLTWASESSRLPNNEYVIQLWTDNAHDFNYFESELRKRNYGNIVVFVSSHPYASDWGHMLGQLSGMKIAVEEFSTDPPGFQSQILKAKNAGVDAIGLCLNAPQNGLFVRQLAELHTHIPVFGCNFLEASADLNVARKSFEGVWFTAPLLTEEFRQAYVSRFKTTDHLVSGAVHFEAAKLLAQAAQGDPQIPLMQRMKRVTQLGGALIPDNQHGPILVQRGPYLFLSFKFGTYVIRGGQLEVNMDSSDKQ